jgi:hypothetical protein
MKVEVRPYTDWEDWKAGMYADASGQTHEQMIEKAVALLGDRHRLFAAMRDVTIEWPRACDANLSEPPNNRAWLGQAACCFACEVPEDMTRAAWGRLTDDQRLAANRVADEAIGEWQHRTRRNPQMEFSFNA